MLHSITRRRFLSLAAGTFAAAPCAAAFVRESTGLIVHTEVPMNAEPPLSVLTQNWQTPTEHFYIRSHAAVPEIDADDYRLRIRGLVDREMTLSLGQLGEYDRQSVTATMTCAGNRRYEHSKSSPVKGVPWREGAIGNAEWSGVRLSELLKQAGLKENAKHVWFDGVDAVEHEGGVIPFGGSIPLAKAMSDTAAVPGALVTTRMNAQPLTPDHGWPVRMVVPGYIGARSVKWLGRITLSDRPSPNHYVADAYKIVTEGTPLEWAEQAPIYRYPINAAICTPQAGADVKSGRLRVAGYALPPGQPGRTIQRVLVSLDEGTLWRDAELTSPSREYCWQLWSLQIGVRPEMKSLMVRAVDSAGNDQPAAIDWNLKGYLYNAWHRVPIHVTS